MKNNNFRNTTKWALAMRFGGSGSNRRPKSDWLGKESTRPEFGNLLRRKSKELQFTEFPSFERTTKILRFNILVLNTVKIILLIYVPTYIFDLK